MTIGRLQLQHAIRNDERQRVKLESAFPASAARKAVAGAVQQCLEGSGRARLRRRCRCRGPNLREGEAQENEGIRAHVLQLLPTCL